MERRLLFEPISLGTVRLRNRIVFPPMTTGYESQGHVTGRSRAFYRRVARGGAGLIVIGDVSIQPSFAPTPYAYDDGFVPGLRALVDEVHAEGARIAAQLFHQEYDTAEVGLLMRTAGRERAMERLHADFRDYCNRLTHDDIATILERFRRAALRVRDAGFDLIQLHGDRLVGMFCSPLLNRRTDDYGGSLANRARFALEVVRTIRSAVPDLTIEYKMAVIRRDPPMGKAGPTLAEAQAMVPWLEEAGVAAFHVALANHDGLGDTIPAMGTQPFGCFLDLAVGIKSVATVPVTAVGRILDPHFAEGILASGQADLVGIGRGLIAEPDWPVRVERGEADRLRLCIMCNHCAGSLMSGKPLECAINPAIGAEDASPAPSAAARRRVLVIGGGPAGMEAAQEAASLGHDVTLVECGDRLGGQLPLCAAPPHKDEVNRLARYLEAELVRQRVRVCLGVGASPGALLDELRPEFVIVATGGHPAMLDLPGFADAGVLSAWEVLSGAAAVSGRVAIVGGGAVGVETALYVAERGHPVTIVEMRERIAEEESPTVLPYIESQIRRHGIRVLTRRRVLDRQADELHVADPDGHGEVVACDTVVVAAGTHRNPTFAAELEARGIAYRTAGDCAEGSAGTLASAIRDGFRAAQLIC
jgi:2,4-dienoyl-CoA reductase-like NADH-dependent reductase (Old Yellow Enzyme family)/thioredoxin reductase